ncbi:MAG: FGGY-family carbohydrate kinase [Oscillospiraceae bacterium]
MRQRQRPGHDRCVSVDGKATYALEGSVFVAGAVIQWLRDELRPHRHGAATCEYSAQKVDGHRRRVSLSRRSPGLGAPYWDMYARGAIVGLTRGSNKAHIARATLEGIAYQVKDLLDAMQVDAESPISVLRVDGGASVSSFLMQFQADMLRVPIDRPKLVETTAFGAAFLAGIASGVWESVDDIALLRQSTTVFSSPKWMPSRQSSITIIGCAPSAERKKWSQE